MPKFSDLQLEFVRAYKTASPLTVEQYQVCYRNFLAFLKETRHLTDDVRHFTEETVQAFVEHMQAAGVTANTVRSKLSALSALARVGMMARDTRGRHFLAADPTKAFRWPKGERRETKYLYAHELKAFWAAPCARELDIAREVLIDTGARVSSLVTATVGDVRVINGQAFLRLKVKGGRREVVPLSTPAAQKLDAYLRGRELTDKDDDRPLLARENGDAWKRTALSQALVRLGQAVGITRLNVSAHKLRHTNNVFGRGAGLDEFTRAKLLTHASTATLKVYDHEIPGEMAKARERQRQHMEEEVGRVMDAAYDTANPALDEDESWRGFA